MEYNVRGNIVARLDFPRFRVVMNVENPSQPQPGDVEWIDDPPADVYALTGFLQEAVRTWREQHSGGD